jgi:hypothetical protein
VLSPLVPWRRSLGTAAPSQFRSATLRAMAEYAVAHLEEIDELSDGRAPFRPIRHKLGITSFGVNTWTGHEAADRIINEHDEAGWDEELYFVRSECLASLGRDACFKRESETRLVLALQPGSPAAALSYSSCRCHQDAGPSSLRPSGARSSIR